MKRNLTYIFTVLVVLFSPINRVSSQDITGKIGKLAESPFYLPVVYKGEVVSNLCGGYATGTECLGYGTIGLGFDTEKAKFWKGGTFYVEGATTHGGSPSADYIGDAQIASNIEAGNHIYLQQLYYRQEIGDFYLSLGLLDMNSNFCVCCNSVYFHNSSFGTHSVLSYNMPAPIFPVTALGFYAGWDISDRWNVQLGIYDGNPEGFDDNPFNVYWSELGVGGFLTTSEVTYRTDLGEYTINGYYHTGLYKVGGSLSLCQTLFRNDRHDFNAFFYGALSERHNNILHSNLNMGLVLKGVFSKKSKDLLGLGIATSFFVNRYTESAIELLYTHRPFSWLSLEPDLQYIINPLGEAKSLDNAFVARLRVVIEL